MDILEPTTKQSIHVDALSAANTGLELVENIVQWDLSGQSAYKNCPERGARIAVTFPISIRNKETASSSIAYVRIYEVT